MEKESRWRRFRGWVGSSIRSSVIFLLGVFFSLIGGIAGAATVLGLMVLLAGCFNAPQGELFRVLIKGGGWWLAVATVTVLSFRISFSLGDRASR